MINATELYNHMEADFRLSACSDDWSEIEPSGYITSQYLKRYMGLVTDNTDTISCAYTAVFPSPDVINKIIRDDRREAMLFVHHPMHWDITKTPVFTSIPLDTLEELRTRKISIYNLHTPLDAIGPYGTTVNLANALGITKTDEFCQYHGVLVGVIGTTDCGTVAELIARFERAVGHEVTLYPYGDNNISVHKVALVAGGGNDADVYPYLHERGINTFITGVASMRTGHQPSVDAHNSAKENGVNILAGSHYSTEKFACIKMVEYFSKLGIQGEFVASRPCMHDI